MRSHAFTCQELVELVTDYLEDALDHVDRRAFEAHVADCRGCAAYLAQIHATIRLVRATADLLP